MQNKGMRYCIRLTVLVGVSIVVGLLAERTPAQTNAQERAANLRAQLADTEARQTELQSRLQQLEENLKPENIERTLAGVGSVHPEELREARRRQLENEKRGVQSQLDTLGASRSRLETAIAADAAAGYRQSAGPGPNISAATDNITSAKQTPARHRTKKHRLRKRH
jgi:TolA-binding protein